MIELKGVSFQYKSAEENLRDAVPTRSTLALDHVSLKFKEEESVAIIGSNGSGKTTLAKLLNALILPDKGEVSVDGLSTSDKDSQKTFRQKVGMVFQNPDNQIISTSVEREVAFGLENLALPYQDIHHKVQRALKFFNLEKYKFHPPHKLSGGEKQKVALAAVLSMQPKYLVLDEPTSLLDPVGRREVLSLISMLDEERNVTVIHITQFSEEAVKADRVIVMHQGGVVLDGSPLDVFKQKEKLREIGLDIPFPMRIASKLKQKGWDISDDCLTLDDLVNQIAGTVKNGKMKLKEFTADRGRPTADNKLPRISMNQVSYLYDQGLPTARKALDQISLEVKKGEFIGLVGPTGSGKSTLVQHLNALLTPTSGEVLVDGGNTKEKTTDLKKLRQKVGLVFQFPELQLFEETVYKDIAFGPRNLGLSEQEIDIHVKESMKKVGLDFKQFAHRSPFALSGGEQRKVAVAGILALQPEILVLDEPTCGLDAKSTREIEELLQELNSTGVTIILISHNMDLIAKLAHKIVLLDQGRLLAFCDKEEFFKDAERIRSVGLDLPRIVELGRSIKEKGIQLGGQVFSEDALIDMLS
jgi:energy-coupling factor transport system ATP-binding protein